MQSSARKLTADMILGQIGRLKSVETTDPQAEALRRAYRQAASVLAGLRNPDALRPIGGGGGPGEGRRLLANDLVPATGRKLQGSVMLRHEVRRQALSELGTRAAMQNALSANPDERTGPVQMKLEHYLQDNVDPLETMSGEELEETLQVLLWLDGILDKLPDINDVRNRLREFTFMKPFEVLAGDAVFCGRQDEIDDLREFVGVLPPESLLKRMTGGIYNWLKPDARPALSVSGPGGVGKSALIARFVLEHARVPEAARFPYAYLDFDNPTLNVGDPMTLLTEIFRQLELQFPRFDKIRKLDQFLQRQLEKLAKADESLEESDPGLSRVASVLADLLGILQLALGPRPFLLVLDTFEEEQYRGEARAFPLWNVLARMQKSWPFLRVVISGRAPVRSLILAGKPPEVMQVGDLDHAAALGFLKQNGVTDPALAEALVKQVGGVPLSLKLAAALVVREEADENGLRDLKGKSVFWISAADDVIQGQLYDRILDHIHNRQVAQLAHPGLVLRRITPEVILKILREPCGLLVDTIQDAQMLFDELRKETSLVSYDDAQGALLHRTDLRRMMLKFLVQKAPAQVRQIHELAEQWYGSQKGKQARCEELYHRLQLGESVHQQLFTDSDIFASIQASIAELPFESQARLAALGFEVDPVILRQSTREQSESYVAAKIEDLLPYSPESLPQAAALLKETGVPKYDSPLFRANYRVAFQQGQSNYKLIEDGLRLAAGTGNTGRILELLCEKAWASEIDGDNQSLTETLALLREYAERHDDRHSLVQYYSQAYRLAVESKSVDQADDALLAIKEAITSLTPLGVFELMPTFRGLLNYGAKGGSAILSQLLAKIRDPDSPFAYVEFGKSRADRPLQSLLKIAYAAGESAADVVRSDETADTIPTDLYEEAAISIESLIKAWPYRVLRVKPRESHHARGMSVARA